MTHQKLDNEFLTKPTSEEEKTLIAQINSQRNRGKRLTGNEKNIKLLIKGLADKNGLIRRVYTEELGKIGNVALPELINTLINSKSIIQRSAAAKTLKLVGNPSALPHLINALTNDKDPLVQCSAAGAIAIFGETAVNHLVVVLENKNYTQMQHGLASWCLSFIGVKAQHALIKAAKSKNSNVRSAAISALEEQIRESKDPKELQILEASLNDEVETVQIEGIKLIGKLYRIESLIPILISKLSNKSPEIRKASIVSIMQLNINEALKPLKNLIDSEKEIYIKKIARLAIHKISE